MTRGRLLAAVVSVALVVGAGSGVAAFALEGGFTDAATPTTTTGAPTIGQSVQCGPSSRCIPSLPADAVIGAVEAAGFVCDNQPRYSICNYDANTTAFELQVNRGYDDDHLLESVIGSGRTAPDTDAARIVRPYLLWVAALPFGDDPAAAQVMAWADEQIEGASDTRAKIGGYDYEVTHRRNSVTLAIHTFLGFEDELWGDS